MRTSDAIDKLAPAIVKAQAAIKPAIKDATNPAFRSRYADLAAVWEAVRGALAAAELAVVQLPVHDAGERVHLTTRLVHASGQWLEETASIPVAKKDAHGFGSGYTYLRRYALSALLGVVADEDDDGNKAVEPAKTPDTAKQVAVDAFDALPPEDKAAAQRHAITLIAINEDDQDMASYIERQGFTDEEKLAIWSLLPAPVRSAIKKQQAAAREAKRIAGVQRVPMAEQA